MPDRLRFTILGCGSSPGVPRINGDWGKCDPNNPKNRRRRASMLVERIADSGGVTAVVIDTGPDFRSQMIDFGSGRLDAVIYTHAHADHIHGLDDLRTFVIDRRDLVDIYADVTTQTRLLEGFRYCFERPEGSSYPPILRPHEIVHNQAFEIGGPGGSISFLPLPQVHGDILSLGFRIKDVAYCSDVSAFPDTTAAHLFNLDTLVIDALQYRPHPSHFSLDESIEWINKLKPRRAILTHMHVPLDYETVLHGTPDNVEPAFDGLSFEVEL
jgi:phosphoribosyl 1,2-cyclic phosphate phosphodiesterase